MTIPPVPTRPSYCSSRSAFLPTLPLSVQSFCVSLSSHCPLPLSTPSHLIPSHRRPCWIMTSQLSSPFPPPDPFAFPPPAFPTLSAGTDLRPELLGALLWSVGLYLGFSQRTRWASSLRTFLSRQLSTSGVFSTNTADIIADALHPFPFLAMGVITDVMLRSAANGNAVWAVATGLSVALYAGVYELARQATENSKLNSEEKLVYAAFVEFADVQLTAKGMCHFVDVRDAIRKQASVAPLLRGLSDESIRRFVASKFPRAKRSPNGYYRGLSIKSSQRLDISSSKAPTA